MDEYQERVLHYLHSLDETMRRIEEQNARIIHYLNELTNPPAKPPGNPSAAPSPPWKRP